jgi:hypothetical protein
MSNAAQFPLVGGAYTSRSLKLDAQRCVNFYPVLGESGTAKAVRALFGTPGLRRLATLDGAGGLRALYRPSSGDAIAVQGSTVYRVAKDWTFRRVGTIDGLATPVSIADDGTRAVLVTGPNGYTLELGTDALEQIQDEAFYGADFVAYSKTVFVFNRPGTRQFYLSLPGVEGLKFDATDFASATSNGEALVRHIINNEDLLLFKRTKTEIWRAYAGGEFLFTRDVNAVIEKGCEAPRSVVSMDNTVYWLGGDGDGGGVVWKLNGYTAERVSHAGLEFAIQNYATTEDAQAWSYQQEGHTFYVLTFPSARATWAYDVATGFWHERAYLDPGTGIFDRHRAACHMHYGGEHVVGDWADGRLYALDLDCFTDDGDPLVALRAAPHISGASYNEIRYNSVTVDLEEGVGTVDGQGVNPVLMLRWSNDGGRTWGALQSLPMGRMGEYTRRVKADRLGTARDRVFEISISDPVKRAVLGAAVEAVDLGR